MAKGLAGTSLINDANLVSYWQLEDTTDFKGTNNLTNNNSVAFNPAKFDNGADGGSSNSNKYLSKASNLGFGYNSTKSISLWVKLNTEIASSIWNLYDLRTTTPSSVFDLEYQFNSGTRQLLVTRYSDTSGISAQIPYTVTMGTSNWYHLVVVFDATNHTLALYVNGTLISQISATDTSSSTPGAYSDGFAVLAQAIGVTPTSGIIDDMAIFSRALSASDVTTIYNSPTGLGGAWIGKYLGA
jgi:hypothetical protein